MRSWGLVVRTIIIWSLLLVVGTLVFIYSGRYDIGADVHHTRLVAQLIGALRDHSIDTRITGIAVPDLNDPERIAEGAEHYDAMCTGCHLAPGMTNTELREGLYPRPPNLTRFSPEPRTAFWVIKHGIKMSGMPAWGLTHDDEKIWAMVAFLQKLPDLTPAQYRALVPEQGGGRHDVHEHDDQHVPGKVLGGDGSVPVTSVPAPAARDPDAHEHATPAPEHAHHE